MVKHFKANNNMQHRHLSWSRSLLVDWLESIYTVVVGIYDYIFHFLRKVNLEKGD